MMFNSYLETPAPQLFAVDEYGTAWVWEHESSTALIDQQLALILEILSNHLPGIPSIVPIMCITSAQRNWEGKDCWVERLKKLPARGVRDGHLEKVVNFLQFISQLPRDVRHGVEGTVAILASGLLNKRSWFFELDNNDCQRLVDHLQLTPEERTESISSEGGTRRDNTRCRRAWETLVELANSISSTEQIKTMRQAGVSDTPQPIDIENLPELETATEPTIKSVVDELKKDPIHESIASLSQSLGSMISLPRKPTSPDDLPMGGVSDITNRGSPERLLSSELAADPMVMLARIANGQALYMRKETPPAPQPNQRDILIESSVRSWGLRRVFIAAAALGIGLEEERRSSKSTSFYIASGQNCDSCNFTDHEDVVRYLGRLDIDRDPVIAIQRFFEDRVEQQEGAELATLLIITSELREDPVFKQALFNLPLPVLVLDISRDGQATLRITTKQGSESLQKLRLELPETKKRSASEQRVTDAFLPAFTSFSEPPLLFPPPNQNSKYLCLAGENWTSWLATADGRLLRFGDAKKGGLQIGQSLPGSNVLAMKVEGNCAEGITSASGNRHYWFRADPNDEPIIQHQRLDVPMAGCKYWVGGRFVLAFADGLEAVIRKEDGAVLEQQRTSRRHMGLNYALDDHNQLWMHGGATPNDWHQISEVSTLKAPAACVLPNSQNEPHVLAAGLEHMYVMGKQTGRINTLVKLTERRSFQIPLKAQYEVVCSNRTSSRWIVKATSTHQHQSLNHFMVDMHSRTVSPLYDANPQSFVQLLDSEAAQTLIPRPIRTRITAVRLTKFGLMFRGPKHRYVLLKCAEQSPKRLILRVSGPGDGNDVEFEKPIKLPTSDGFTGWTLREARIPGGYCWLDSRGLIHLKREDDTRELTLILADAHVAGWFSSTGCFGPTYYHHAVTRNQTASGRDGGIPVPNEVLKWLENWRLEDWQ